MGSSCFAKLSYTAGNMHLLSLDMKSSKQPTLDKRTPHLQFLGIIVHNLGTLGGA